MATPDTKHSLVVVKQFTYRGSDRRWSNRYHFEGALPSDHSSWTALANAVTDAEKVCFDPSVTIVEALGYDAGTATPTNPHGDAVYTGTYSKAGTLAGLSGKPKAPGDAAVLVRYATPARSTRNHPVYLFNYYHGVWLVDGGGDGVLEAQRLQFQALGEDWVDGFPVDGSARERCGPRGAVATGVLASGVVRHRDFPN